MINRFIAILLVFLAGPSALRAQRFQQQVNYSIDVTLTDSTHTLDGSIRIQYINHSPDTLSYIWIHCCPNAFKSDRTDFSEELIRSGRTDFYFSDKSQKGYINRLEFRVDGKLAHMEDHPRYLDMIRVSLPEPLPPGSRTTLSTPFHVQLPDNFSHFGYHGGIYELANWYPAPAVFDQHGWHPEPYLDHGGAYNEYGDFDVRISLPADFVVLASGQLETTPSPASGQPDTMHRPNESSAIKSLHYHGADIPEFAWFASRRFRIDRDTMSLPSGRIIELRAAHRANAASTWKYSLGFLKSAIRFYSHELGDYPFNVATVVETLPDAASPVSDFGGGASHPGLIAVDGRDSNYSSMRLSIARSVGNIWLSVAVGADALRFPWMTEGIGCYYLNQYPRAGLKVFPLDTFRRALVNTRAVLKEDQPVSTPLEDLTPDNYRTITGYKTSILLEDLRRRLGAPMFDSCMHAWFRQQQFHHSDPGDWKAILTSTSGRDFDTLFTLLESRGPVPPCPYHRRISPSFQTFPYPTHSGHLNISPAIGFNDYDHFMVGALIHNFNLPPDHWQVLAAPLYGTVSHQWNGLFHVNYSWFPRNSFRLIEAGVNGSRFSTTSGTDSNGRAIFGSFYKIVPYLRVFFPRPFVGSTRETWLEGKSFLIGESGFSNYVLKSTDSQYYPTPSRYAFRYLNQLSFTIRDNRTLYPYCILVQAQQAAAFYRINLDIDYFFNYGQGGGLAFRLFGAKFGYLGSRNPAEDLTPFEPKLTALRGTDDYTYQDYFIGRSQFTGLASQQILDRDGNLPLRTDLFQGLQGRSDNWVGAVNLTSTLPPVIVPGWFPLRVFLDIGTYAQAWGDNPPTGHFLYVGGFQLSLLHDVLRIYAPLVYSGDFSSQLKTVSGQNGFLQKISFSIDFAQLPFRKYFGYTPF